MPLNAIIKKLRRLPRHAASVSLLFLFSVATASGQELSLAEIVRGLPETLDSLGFLVEEDGILGAGKNAEDWRRTCEDYSLQPVFAAGGGAPEQEEQKKTLRGLFASLARIGYQQYDFQIRAETRMDYILRDACTVDAKMKGWAEQLKATVDAIKAFDKAMEGGKSDAIKKAGEQLRSHTMKGGRMVSDMLVVQQEVEYYTKKYDWSINHITTEMGKRKDMWGEIFGSALDLPGVKTFVEDQKKQIDEVIKEYGLAIDTLIDASEDVMGDTPRLLTDAGIQGVKLADLKQHWEDLRISASAELRKRGYNYRVPLVD